MNISEHVDNFIQEMYRRNYSKKYSRKLFKLYKTLFSQSKKDHPKTLMNRI